MTPLERRSPVRSDGRHTDMALLSRLERAESSSSLPLATVRARPMKDIHIQRWRNVYRCHQAVKLQMLMFYLLRLRFYCAWVDVGVCVCTCNSRH